MDITALYQVYKRYQLVSTDTRKIERNCIFFALKGDRFDGNKFAAEAISKGAFRAVVDDKKLPYNKQFIYVNDALVALQQLARFHREKSGYKIVAITGSNGKTTTKNLCEAILLKQYKVNATAGNLNNHIGVPLSILAMDKKVRLGIIEMGANHSGEISLLCETAAPDYGLITNIGKAHLEGFGGMDGVIRAKGELFEYLMQKNKTLMINQGDPNVTRLVPDHYANKVYYNGEKGIHAENIKCTPFVEMDVLSGNRTLRMKTRLVGRYNVENVLAACCVGRHLGINDDEIIDAINSYQPQDNRSQLIATGNNKIYMDAYNANPSSMLTAIKEFLSYKEKKILLILGEMKEVGDTSVEEHEVIISFLKSQGISDVLCVGESFKVHAGKAGFPMFGNVDELLDYLKPNPVRQRFVFIKGSRSNKLERVLEVL